MDCLICSPKFFFRLHTTVTHFDFDYEMNSSLVFFEDFDMGETCKETTAKKRVSRTWIMTTTEFNMCD